MYKKLRNIFIAATLVFIGAPFAFAQQSAVPAPIQYVVSPETPGPNTTVTIEAQGVGTFIGDSTITWSLNGKVVASGAGVRAVTFTTGPLGSQSQVHVRINSTTQGVITNDWVIIPSSINLIWEADTSAPPMYRGKPLYSGGSTVRVVAFPSIVVNGKNLSVNSLSFQWQLDGNPAPQQSGVGRNVLEFTGDQLQPQEDVGVTVYYGASKVGYGQVSIAAVTPSIVLYDKDPLRGLLLDSALGSAISLSAKELTMQAVPYNFANSSIANGGAAYAWTLNGETITGPNAQKGMLTLRQTGSGAGAARIGVQMQNNDSDKLVQAAQTVLNIVFGQSSTGTSLFGL
jgi:hypothetical protein